MPVSSGYRDYIVEQLTAISGLSVRRMFGGLGVYAGELFFAVMDDDDLFFKVDDVNRPDYQARGAKAFQPVADKASMNYFQVPADVIEDAEELTRWARRSIEVSRRAAQRKKQPAPKAAAKRIAKSRSRKH